MPTGRCVFIPIWEVKAGKMCEKSCKKKSRTRPETTQRAFINHKTNQKLELEWTMNGLENQFRVNIKHKTVNIEVKLPHLKKNQIAPSGQNPKPAHSLKLEWKHFKPQNRSLFLLQLVFGVTKISNSIWLKKSWNCEQIFKKRQQPQYNN